MQMSHVAKQHIHMMKFQQQNWVLKPLNKIHFSIREI